MDWLLTRETVITLAVLAAVLSVASSVLQVKQVISGHLCRCGAYPNIFKATLAAAHQLRGHDDPSSTS